MKKSYIQVILGCLFIYFAIQVYLSAAEYPSLDRFPSKSFDQQPLTIELTGPKNLLVGEQPNLWVEFTNVSDKPIEFVQTLDGSWYHWRYTYISVEVYDENVKVIPFNLGGRCGNMNPIVPDDIKRLNPGEKANFYIGWPFSESNFEKPGKYELLLFYDLRAPNTEGWSIDGRFSGGKTNPKIKKRLKCVPKLLIKSDPMNIEVHSVTKNMIENMIVEYYHGRERSLFDFVEKDLKSGKWRVLDIRQSNGWISCLVEFVDGYSPPLRPKYVTKNYWLEQGYYLFEPSHKSPNIRVHALPNSQTPIFKLHLPQDAAILTKKYEWLQSLTVNTELESKKPLIPLTDTKAYSGTPKRTAEQMIEYTIRTYHGTREESMRQ